MKKRISFYVPDYDYEIIEYYTKMRGYNKVGELARRAIYRYVNQNPPKGKRLGEPKPDPIIYYSDMKSPGWIYFICIEINKIKYCKIGRTAHKTRYSELQVGLPVDIEIFKEIHVGNTILAEQAFHSLFKDKKIRGEWFKLTKDDLNEINSKGLELVKIPNDVRTD